MSESSNVIVIRESPDGTPPAVEMGGMKFRGRSEITVQNGRVLVDGVLKGVFIGSYGVVCKSGLMTEATH